MAAQGQSIPTPTDAELLQAQADLWRHSLYYLKSMAMKCAAELGIPTAIYRLGGSASLPDLIVKLSLPQAKLPFLGRLMRLLASSGVFTMDSTEAIYGLTPLSYLLVEDIPAEGHFNHAPFLLTVTSTRYIDLAMGLADWLKKEEKAAPFDHVHGASLFDEESMGLLDPEFHDMAIKGLLVHDNFAVDIALREFRDIFQGIKSLTDCCYHGDGSTAKAIVKAFPHMKVTVLDLPQEIKKIPADGVVNYVGGDMFKSIPPAQVVMLKMVLHHWSDEDSVKILANCKKAIPSREQGGKVLIGDIVLDPSAEKMYETQLLMDVCMMLMKGGRQRDENDWRELFMKAGFSDYKLVKKFGARGVIEVYP